jgi:hypothetical protein
MAVKLLKTVNTQLSVIFILQPLSCNSLYQFIYDHGSGKALQTELWDNLLQNVGQSTGGKVSESQNSSFELNYSFWPW